MENFGVPAVHEADLPSLWRVAFEHCVPTKRYGATFITLNGAALIAAMSIPGMELGDRLGVVFGVGALSAGEALRQAHKKYKWLKNEATPSEVLELRIATYYSSDHYLIPGEAWISSSEVIREAAQSYFHVYRHNHSVSSRFEENVTRLVKAGHAGSLFRIMIIASSSTDTDAALERLRQHEERVKAYDARNLQLQKLKNFGRYGVSDKLGQRFNLSMQTLEQVLRSAPEDFTFNGREAVERSADDIRRKLDLLEASEASSLSRWSPSARKLTKEIESAIDAVDRLRGELVELFQAALPQSSLDDTISEVRGIRKAYIELAPLRGENTPSELA